MRTLDDFLVSLPRSNDPDGRDLTIADIGPAGEAVITDDARTATYAPMLGRALLGAHLCIVTVETGWFGEADAICLSDGDSEATYVAISVTS